MKNQHHTASSWRRWFLMVFPSLAAILVASVLTLPALAATVSNVTRPVDFTIANPCNGEVVAFSGTEHATFSATLDGSGGAHVHSHINEHASGVGSFGNKYQFPAAENYEFDAKVAQEEIFTLSELIVSQGSAPNFVLKSDFHVTVNPDGTVTSFRDNLSIKCRG